MEGLYEHVIRTFRTFVVNSLVRLVYIVSHRFQGHVQNFLFF